MFALGHRNPDVVAAVEAELHKMPMSGKVLLTDLWQTWLKNWL